jgi:hypothetical protein
MKGKKLSRRLRIKKRFSRRTMRGGSDKPPQVYIFYHIFCNSNTDTVVRDQVTKILFSGLYDDVSKIFCYLTGKKEDVAIVETFLKTLPKKFVIQEIGIDDKSFERFTLNKIKDIVHDKDKFLYIHSKGVTHTPNEIEGSGKVYLWRTYMEYYLIRHYKKCLEKLDTHDIVGVMYKDFMIGPHFSGNFWWSTGAYFKRLTAEHKIGDFYTDTESFIFKAKPNFYKIDGTRIANDYFLDKAPDPMYTKRYMNNSV